MNRKITIIFAFMLISVATFAQSGFVSMSSDDATSGSSSTLGQLFAKGSTTIGYLSEGLQQPFLYRGADTLLQETSTYPTVYRPADRNPLHTDHIVDLGLTPDSLYLLPLHGIDSLLQVMAYGATFSNDTIVIAPYNKPTFAFNLIDPIILPDSSVPPVQFENNHTGDFTVGEITPVVWRFRVANKELIDTQFVNVMFPPCGTDNYEVVNNPSYPFVVINPLSDPFKATDYESNEYNTTRIAYYCWTKENLKSAKYSDGVDVENPMPYKSAQYPNETENLEKYGYLYTWNDALRCQNTADLQIMYNDTLPKGFVQGVCPEGWRVPSAEEMQFLMQFPLEDLMSTSGWLNATGTDATGFTALPAGFYSGTNFQNLMGEATFWTSTFTSSTVASFGDIKYSCPELLIATGKFDNGYSVRCLKN